MDMGYEISPVEVDVEERVPLLNSHTDVGDVGDVEDGENDVTENDENEEHNVHEDEDEDNEEQAASKNFIP